MNRTQEQLLGLLSLAIHGGKPDIESFSTIEEEELYSLVIQQNVYSLLYPIVNKYHLELKLDNMIMCRWKKVTIYSAFTQMNMMNEIKVVFSLFKSNEIPVISLKGLVLKQLYLQPEQRIMSDIDLLIDEKNIKKSIDLLVNLGYQPASKDFNHPNYMHISLKKPGSLTVELHRTLWHPTIMKKCCEQIWINHIWDSRRVVQFQGIQFTALSLEDEFINLIVHMARHIMDYGAQLRQLCDFVLFIKAYWNTLDFKYIGQTIKLTDLYEFYQCLLRTCNLYLRLKIPITSDVLFLNDYKCKLLINLFFLDSSNIRQAKDGKWYWKKLRELKIALKSIPYMTKNIRIIRYFVKLKSKGKSLRSVGLYLRY